MPIFPVPSGQFAGYTQAQLQGLLQQAQAALIAIQLGQKTQSVSYAQADGSKSVSFTATSRVELQMLVRQVTQALGLGSRRALRVVFR